MFGEEFYPTPRAVIASIYRITNSLNGKVYIGFTTHRYPKDRFHKHATASSQCNAICAAFTKYGRDAFVFEVIYQSKDVRHTRQIMEPYFISLHNSYGRGGYNLTTGGEGSTGYKRTPEQIERMRRRAIGKQPTNATRARMSQAHKNGPRGASHHNYGRKQSQETINRRTSKLIGRHRSQETKQRQSQAQQGALGSGYGKRGAMHHCAKTYRLEKLDGSIVEFTGLADFCRRNREYSPAGLSSMATGKRTKYKDVHRVWLARASNEDAA